MEVTQSVYNGTEITDEVFEYEYGNANDTDSAVSILAEVMFAAIYGFSLISVIVNIFNIYVIVSSRLCRQLSYALILNLSFSDAFVAFSISVYFIVTDIKPEWIDIMWLSVVMDYIYTILSLATLLTVFCMTCDLFYMIKWPLKHRRHFKDGQKLKIIIACIWILAIVPAILLDFVIPLFHADKTVSYVEEATTDLYEPYWVSLFAAIICLFTMIILYCIIIKEIYKSHKMNYRGKMRKSAVTVCLIVLTYFLLYLPYWITIGAWVLDSLVPNTESELFDLFYLMTFLLQIINTACDPLIYAFRITKIRQSARKIFCNCMCKVRCHTCRKGTPVMHISNNANTESTT